MSDVDLHCNQPSCVMGLEARNRKAHDVIAKYAKKHAAMDVGLGLTGLIPIPGATTAALIAAILAQAPLIYGPMTKELAGIYSASVDGETRRIAEGAMMISAATDLATELGREFLQEIASELISEAAMGFAATAIPFIGAFIAAGIDAAVAATLTWRVGTMVSAYYQNGEAWIGDRRKTYHIAKELVGGYSPGTEARANLNDLGRRNTEIERKQLAFVVSLIDMLRNLSSNRTQIVEALRRKQIPEHLVQEGLRVAFAI